MHTFLVHNGMTVAQRDLLRITSTFQAIIQKGDKHSRWQLGMNNGKDYEQMSIA